MQYLDPQLNKSEALEINIDMIGVWGADRWRASQERFVMDTVPAADGLSGLC